ncbi:MAG: type II toxin-antitoxin system RelE/ParE family toxin [Rhodospirillaceae bacterium]|nr:type II toxin-antitoxin system RelE/ParE family toxin [Rhodospirillaceae bacterium]
MSIRVLKNRTFARWAKDEQVTDADLCQAAHEIENGLVEARLGGFLLKKRVARANGGKSGGFRTIVAHRQGSRLFFIFGFAKSDQANITKDEKKGLIKIGDEYMALNDKKLADLIKDKKILEVNCNG